MNTNHDFSSIFSVAHQCLCRNARKKYAVAVTVFLAFFGASAENSDKRNWRFELEPFLGMKYGQIDEYVFLEKSNFSDDLLSELNWQIQPELHCGIRAHGGWKNGFALIGFGAGIPMRTGKMFDSDWLNNDPASVSAMSAAGHDYKTHYSKSDNFLDYDFDFSVKGGYIFSPLRFFRIRPAVEFSFQGIKFTAKNGTALYGAKNDGGYYEYYKNAKNEISFDGQKVISYQRESYILWLGADFSFLLPRNWSIDCGLFVSPYMYAASRDSHFLTETDYLDITYDFFAAFKGSVGVSYEISPEYAISLSGEYFFLSVLRGNDYSKKSTESKYGKIASVEGGAGAWWFDSSISFKIKI